MAGSPPPSPSPPLPPLPPLSPSLSLSSLPLERSSKSPDVPVPRSLQLPSTIESGLLSVHDLPRDDEEQAEIESVSLSLLSSLPESALETTSVLTPTSLALSSTSTASMLPASMPFMPQTTEASSVMSPSISTSVDLSSFTQSSSSLMPTRPRSWAAMTDMSYDSSVLQPSISMQSISLPQDVDASFETSFLRPSGSASSAGRMSAIPVSPSPATSAPPQSPLESLTPVPALLASVTSQSDVPTSTTISSSSESSSSSGRTLSTCSTASGVSALSQSSLSSSIFDYTSLVDYLPEEPAESIIESIPEPSTEPSLLSSLPQLPSRTPTRSLTPSPSLVSTPTPPTPTPPTSIPSTRIATPEGTLSVSLSTPQGSGATKRSTLRTVPSESTGTIRNFGEDIDRLADDLRAYDQARSAENRKLADHVRALRDEFRDLADFLRNRRPSPRSPIVITAPAPAPAPEAPRRGVRLVDQPVGRSSVMSSLIPGGVRVMEMDVPMPLPAASLDRSGSTTSGISYLSSHRSDDGLFCEDAATSSSAPRWPPTESSSSSSSLSTIQEISPSSRPSIPFSKPPSEATVQLPPMPDPLLESLNGLRDRVRVLENGQDAARNLLHTICDQPLPVPVDHHPELEDRLQRIEDLVQTRIEQGHPRGPSPPPTVPRLPTRVHRRPPRSYPRARNLAGT